MQIDEALYKAHIEPLMLLIADALTVVYLRPYLIANGYDKDEVARVSIWYDPSQVATRNDRAADADMGFDKMAVSYNTWRRAHGFSDADAPGPEELALRLVIDKGMITPELTQSMLEAVAPEIKSIVERASQAASSAPMSPEIQSILEGGPAAPAEATQATPEAAPTPAEQPAAQPEPIPALTQPENPTP
jgi:hypothetical protein